MEKREIDSLPNSLKFKICLNLCRLVKAYLVKDYRGGKCLELCERYYNGDDSVTSEMLKKASQSAYFSGYGSYTDHLSLVAYTASAAVSIMRGIRPDDVVHALRIYYYLGQPPLPSVDEVIRHTIEQDFTKAEQLILGIDDNTEFIYPIY